MRIFKALSLSACAAALCAFLTIPVNADAWNKKTVVTFPDAVQIPGQVLAPGTYVFKIVDSSANRGVVEIWNGDQNQLLATLITIPDYRLEAPNHTVIQFDERSGNSPMAVNSWFYPGDRSGWDFIYPSGS